MEKKNKEKNQNIASFQVKEQTGLLAFLFAQMPNKSRTHVKALLRNLQVIVDGTPKTQFDHPLIPGQEVVISANKFRKAKLGKGLQIIYEDDSIIVVNKPAGLLSIATAKDNTANTYSLLRDYVKEHDPMNKIFVVHRLDRETSGIMMFAKSEEIKLKLQENWNDTILERTYIALVEREVPKERQTIRSYLFESKALIVYSGKDPEKGQLAITHYKVIKKNPRFSLLIVNLETGRKNQIRVHMKDIGHPVVGDKKYGAQTNPIGRLGLHAQVLSFIHPVSEKKMIFETAIPVEFQRLVK
ncbi:MAG: RNA pseudouridine synthase [Bacteroidales bacterium]|nr:RNA pseudouridine synthase [Bacteroidales bacterium]MCF8458932.1 RNA pseudouridine synthase [Bacteroidales bacterium]